jgi:TnpA family transposase
MKLAYLSTNLAICVKHARPRNLWKPRTSTSCERTRRWWDGFLRLTGSLKLGVAQASGLMRMLQTNSSPTKLARGLDDLLRRDQRRRCGA